MVDDVGFGCSGAFGYTSPITPVNNPSSDDGSQGFSNFISLSCRETLGNEVWRSATTRRLRGRYNYGGRRLCDRRNMIR